MCEVDFEGIDKYSIIDPIAAKKHHTDARAA
ncbi:hypothetical protein CCP2SC5_330036 [Azospirillaceae bacterium]